MEPPPSKAAGCDIGVQTTTPSLNSLSPILDHRLYNIDDGDSDWSFLDMEKTQPSDNNKRTSARPKSARTPQDGSSQSVPSPEEDGYCSQEELGNELKMDDQSYKSPLKDAPSYSTYLALVPDLHVDGADSEPESPHDEDTISTATSATDTSTTPAITVSDDQAGGLGRDDSTPLFEQSPASTPSELASPTNENLNIDDAERERLKTELAEVELDVEALRQTLRAKELRAKEIRRKLGITQVAVLKSDVRAGWTNFKQSSAYVNTSTKISGWNESITTSEAYSKTKTGFQSAGQKTGAAFSSFGSAVTKKLGEVRESTAFKSFEDKVSTTATTLKTKVAGQKPDEESSFEDVLQSTANERTPDPQPNPPLPEEKVPM